MKEFNVLPTDPRFTALTVEQVDYIISSMVADNKEVDDMTKGINTQSGSGAIDAEFDMDSELVLPDEELDLDLSAQLENMLNSDEERLNNIRNNGEGLSDEELQKLEALSTRRQRLRELDDTVKVLEERGITYDELRGAKTVSTTQEIDDVDRDYAEELLNEFDDDFADLT